MVNIKLAGDSALLIEFGEKIALEVNRQVYAMQTDLEQDPIPGVGETVPAYASLLVMYDPLLTEVGALIETLRRRAENLSRVVLPPAMVTEIPVLYDPSVSDLEEIAALEGKTPEEIIKIHSESDYYVYMIGFSPGHAYTARFFNPFSFKRRPEPRTRIPQGSIIVMEAQTNIIPFDQPCGWNIIGRTPVLACDYRLANPFLLQAGQWVRYLPIGRADFERIAAEVKAGSYRCKTYPKEV